MATMTTEKRRLWKFLRENSVGVLATVDADGDPHAATLYYTTDKPFSIWFVTKKATKKHDNLSRNERTMFVVYDAQTQTSVQVIGVAKKVTDTARSQQVFADVLSISAETSDSKVPPISKLLAGDYITYELEPKQIRMASFASSPSYAHRYKEMFRTFDFD